jgi:MFS family permease
MSTAWLPTCMMRTFGLGAADAGLLMAIFLIVGGTSELLSAMLLDRMEVRGIKDAPFRVHMLLLVVAAPCGIAALLSRNIALFVPLMAVFMFTVFPPLSFMAAATQRIAPPHLRGRASASYILAIASTGSLLGATTVGFLTEHVFGDPNSIAQAMAIVISLAAPLAFVLSWQGLAAYRDLRQSQETEMPSSAS